MSPSEPTDRLAIDGGPAVFPEGPPTWPLLDESVRQSLDRAFYDGSWGSYRGRYVAELSSRLASFHQTPFVTLCCSGTFAVELALRACGVGQDDEVLLAGYDFPGNFRSIEVLGARPVLVDVCPRNWNLDPAQLPSSVSSSTKAIVVSHLHGGVVPMTQVVEFARSRCLSVIEDACQCPGAIIEGRLAGTWGDVGVLSFGGSKLLSAGRGGAILTASEAIHQRAKLFCERGNHAFPLSELQAAVVIPQLELLSARNQARASAVDRLLPRIRQLPGIRPLENSVAALPGYYKLGLKYNASALGDMTKERFLAAVRAEGVALDTGFRGFALCGQRRCRMVGDLTESRHAAAGMMVLHHPVLLQSAETIDRVALAVEKVARGFTNSR